MSPVEGFTICLEYLTSSVTLLVRGELDIATGDELAAVLAAVADKDHLRVVLDLAECDFVDAAGLHVIADAAQHLDRMGGELSVRSPSGVARRLFDLVGPIPFVIASTAGTSPTSRGSDESTGVQRMAALTSPARSTSRLRELVTIPVRDDVIDDALRLVVALARASVEGADGVSVSLRRRGSLSTVAATDQTIRDMDASQYATAEGPCIDASVQGRQFHTGSLKSEARWPGFTPRAQALGISAILSSPLLANDAPVGALNIYSRTTGAFAAKDHQLATIFAAEASTILGDAGLDVTDDQLASRFAAALETRQVITLAQGVTMERDGVDEHDAYTVMRRFSVTTGRSPRERAEDIVASTPRPAPHRLAATTNRTGGSERRNG